MVSSVARQERYFSTIDCGQKHRITRGAIRRVDFYFLNIFKQAIKA